jgi:hypothetical protein
MGIFSIFHTLNERTARIGKAKIYSQTAGIHTF